VDELPQGGQPFLMQQEEQAAGEMLQEGQPLDDSAMMMSPEPPRRPSQRHTHQMAQGPPAADLVAMHELEPPYRQREEVYRSGGDGVQQLFEEHQHEGGCGASSPMAVSPMPPPSPAPTSAHKAFASARQTGSAVSVEGLQRVNFEGQDLWEEGGGAEDMAVSPPPPQRRLHLHQLMDVPHPSAQQQQQQQQQQQHPPLPQTQHCQLGHTTTNTTTTTNNNNNNNSGSKRTHNTPEVSDGSGGQGTGSRGSLYPPSASHVTVRR